MRRIFRPLYGFVIFLFLVSLTIIALAADKKRKSAEPEASSKTKAKPTQKIDPKQQAKVVRTSGRDVDKKKKEEQSKQQLARKKKSDDDDKQGKKRGKEGNKLAARQREEKADRHAKTAKPEAKNEKTKDKSARREQDKKTEKPEKKEVVAKKQPLEKAAKPSADHSKSLAKLEPKAKSDAKVETRYPAKEEKVKELPSVRFTLRPIAKIVPKVELRFSVARAVAGSAFDAPPPPDNGPDVIDVIEHNSSESGRLDDVLRSEMKTLQFSGVLSNSRRKMDVGKMDPERIKQMQEVLAKKGYYSGEISGQYDDATIEAMRKFQTTHKIDVTGYATAQSLRLLGLTDW